MSFFKSNDGVRLHYQFDGSSDQPVVVFLGGYTSMITTWVAQVEAFTNAGFRVLRFEYRNHGQSEQTDKSLRISRLAMDLANLVDYLHVDHFTLIGHSMGAMVASQYISQFSDRRVDAIVTEDQTPKMLNEDGWQYGVKDSSFARISQISDSFPTTKLVRQAIPKELKRQVSDGYVPFDFKKNRPLMIDGIVQDWRDVIRHESIPHLFLAGSASPMYPVDHAKNALDLQKVTGSAMHVFDGAGHIPHLEFPDEFNQIVLEFLKKFS